VDIFNVATASAQRGEKRGAVPVRR
jgi:hypothetical protein